MKQPQKHNSSQVADKTIIISLGGSIIVPNEIDTAFLKEFKVLIERYIKRGFRFIIVSGGGHTCRKYQAAASAVTRLDQEDLDWLGIHSTRLNAHLLRTIFWKHAHPIVIKNPNTARRNTKSKIQIAAGWKPGWSTDYDTVLLAKRFGASTIINMTNSDYVYDKDPKKFRDAKPFKQISWKGFRKIVGSRWVPGMNVPFDPLASKASEKMGLTVAMINGTKLKNLKNLLEGKSFVGTIIS